MTNPVIEYLQTRRSVKADDLTEPGPDSAQLNTILRIASRVPDHKKLAPWRFIVIQGEARARLGEVLAKVCVANEPDATAGRLETERNRFLRAPMVIAVISSPRRHPAVPEWEQVLSAGAVCMNVLHAAGALGFSGHWLTEWYAYDERVCAALGLGTNERIAGFIHLGSAKQPPEERERPDLKEIVTYWTAPAQ